LYAEPVPIRTDRGYLEIPEPQPRVIESAGDLALEETPWKMRPLVWDASNDEYALEVSFEITFCESYHHSWTAVASDEEVIHVLREGSGCGAGQDGSRICDNGLVIEYELVRRCDPPCTIVDDREDAFPGVEIGDDVILRNNDCRC